MPQRLECPVCHKVLIKNTDLVIDEPVVMDLERIKATDKEIKTITCENCKRRLRYFVDK
jgi:transcription elongation factor Elf1